MMINEKNEVIILNLIDFIYIFEKLIKKVIK